MPQRITSQCSQPRCPNLAAADGRCAAHQRVAVAIYERSRGSYRERGYGAAWRRLRVSYLAAYPYCQWPRCQELATDIDHILPRSQGGTDLWDNLQGLCHKHHSSKTATELGGHKMSGR